MAGIIKALTIHPLFTGVQVSIKRPRAFLKHAQQNGRIWWADIVCKRRKPFKSDFIVYSGKYQPANNYVSVRLRWISISYLFQQPADRICDGIIFVLD